MNHCPRGKFRIMFLQASAHNNWSIHILLYVCFCLREHYLIYTIDWSILNLSQQHCNSYPNKAYLTQLIFSIRHTTAFLILEKLDNTSILWLGTIFKKQQNHQQTAEKCEKHGTKEIMKIKLVYSMRVETKWQNFTCFISARNVRVKQLIFFTILYMPMSTKDHKITETTDFGVTDKL